MFAGLDLSASNQKASGICILDAHKKVLQVGKWYEFKEILPFIPSDRKETILVAIDGPLKPPHELDWCCFSSKNPTCNHIQTTLYKGRYGEYLLNKMGFRCFVTSRNSFAKKWMLRCFHLNRFLIDEGFQTIEVFPTATKKLLFPFLKGKKQLKSSREKLLIALKEWGLRFSDDSIIYSHDELDAVLAALTAYIHAQGKSRSIGNDSDGYIIIPNKNLISDI
jgi:predicted nuclease with RNAse H fold